MDCFVVVYHFLEMQSERFSCHFTRSGYCHILKEVLCGHSFSTLLPEDGYRSARYDEAILIVPNLYQLLGFTKIGGVAFVVQTSDIESCSCTQVLSPGYQNNFDVVLPQRFNHISNVTLDDWGVPANTNIIFLKAL